MWRRHITLPLTGARRILLTPAIHMPLAIAIDIAIVIAIATVVDTEVAIAVISNNGLSWHSWAQARTRGRLALPTIPAMMKKRWLVFGLLGLAVLLTGLAWWWWLRSASDTVQYRTGKI